MPRISKEELLMRCAWAAVDRSEDPHLRVGASIMTEAGRIYGVCYNGLPPKVELPPEIMNDRERKRVYMIHAERNLVALAGLLDPHTVAVTTCPCSHAGSCLTSLVAAGVKRVLYAQDYDREGTEAAHEVAATLGLELVHFPMEDPFHSWPAEAIEFVRVYVKLHDQMSEIVEDPARRNSSNNSITISGQEAHLLADLLVECNEAYEGVPEKHRPELPR